MALHFLAEAAFDELLTAWRRHDDLGREAATTVARAHSRLALEDARRRMRRLRQALHPTDDERAAAAGTLLCETLDELVTLTSIHRDPATPNRWRCICGQIVDAADIGLVRGE